MEEEVKWNTVIKINSEEVASFIFAWVDKNGIVSTESVGDVITQCGLLSFLERDVTSKIQL